MIALEKEGTGDPTKREEKNESKRNEEMSRWAKQRGITSLCVLSVVTEYRQAQGYPSRNLNYHYRMKIEWSETPITSQLKRHPWMGDAFVFCILLFSSNTINRPLGQLTINLPPSFFFLLHLFHFLFPIQPQGMVQKQEPRRQIKAIIYWLDFTNHNFHIFFLRATSTNWKWRQHKEKNHALEMPRTKKKEGVEEDRENRG